MMHDFLPMSREDMEKRGWDQCDFVYVCGDAMWITRPSATHHKPAPGSPWLPGGDHFPAGLENKDSITVLGEPRLGFLVTAGNMDSMVNHYSVSKRRREKDSYTPGGVMGKRPDYATVVYCNLIRSVYKKAPIIIGGIEPACAAWPTTITGPER